MPGLNAKRVFLTLMMSIVALTPLNANAQIIPAPGWCSMAHCNDQMTDFIPVSASATITALTTKSPYLITNENSTGVGPGLGCVWNGTNVVCSYKRSTDAIVYYDLSGTRKWASRSDLDGNTWGSAPIIQADGSVVLAMIFTLSSTILTVQPHSRPQHPVGDQPR